MSTDSRLAYFSPATEGGTTKPATPAVKHLGQPAIPAADMVKVLQLRKTAIETIIAERHRVARKNGVEADVRELSATLRAIKRQLVVVNDPDSAACVGCLSDAFNWQTAKFWRGRSYCAKCWKALAQRGGR